MLKIGFIVSLFTKGRDFPFAQQPVQQVSHSSAVSTYSIHCGQVQWSAGKPQA